MDAQRGREESHRLGVHLAGFSPATSVGDKWKLMDQVQGLYKLSEDDEWAGDLERGLGDACSNLQSPLPQLHHALGGNNITGVEDAYA